MFTPSTSCIILAVCRSSGFESQCLAKIHPPIRASLPNNRPEQRSPNHPLEGSRREAGSYRRSQEEPDPQLHPAQFVAAPFMNMSMLPRSFMIPSPILMSLYVFSFWLGAGKWSLTTPKRIWPTSTEVGPWLFTHTSHSAVVDNKDRYGNRHPSLHAIDKLPVNIVRPSALLQTEPPVWRQPAWPGFVGRKSMQGSEPHTRQCR